jgi:hypothetical protein
MRIIPAPRNRLEPIYHLLDTNEGLSEASRQGLTSRALALQIEYDKNLVMGSLYRMKYLDYLHDPEPLAFIIDYVPSLKAVIGLNLHYLIQPDIRKVVGIFKNANSVRRLAGKPPMLDVDAAKALPLGYIPWRLYKLSAIQPKKYLRYSNWDFYIGEKNRWQGFRDFDDVRRQRPRPANKMNESNKTTRTKNKRPQQNKANRGTNI